MGMCLAETLESMKFNKKGKLLYVQRNTTVYSCNHWCSGKATSITYYKCVFAAFGIQHAMCIHHIVSYVVSNLQYFSTLSQKQYDKEKLLNKKNVF